MNGGAGDDTYIWNLGDGLDTIYDAGNNDTISFGDGISFSDLAFQCVNNSDLKIFIKNNPNQGIIIQDFLTSNLNYKIENIDFSKIKYFNFKDYDHLEHRGVLLKDISNSIYILDLPSNDIISQDSGVSDKILKQILDYLSNLEDDKQQIFIISTSKGANDFKDQPLYKGSV